MDSLSRRCAVLLAAVLSGTGLWGCASQNVTNPHTAADRESRAAAIIEEFKAEDPGISRFFDTSAGYVVFPKIGKGGLIVGGGYGDGIVYEKGMVIGSASVTMGSVGAQIGGQTFKEIIFFETPEDLNRFKEEKIEFDARIGAVAVENGKSATAAYHDGVVVFVRGEKGLMAEAVVGGQKFRFFPK